MEDSKNNLNINFISNINLKSISGGWSGLNYQLHQNLRMQSNCTYIGPINPPISFIEKFISKLLRIVSLKGCFYFYSENRLTKIKANIYSKYKLKKGFDIFLGSTPWIKYKPLNPYACIIDAPFPTYMALYHKIQEFKDKDIKRIYALEENWLKSASYIFYTSNWAMEQTLTLYNLDRFNNKHHIVLLGGNINLFQQDKFSFLGAKPYITFISYQFIKKGGMLCWEAFKLLQMEIPGIRLKIIGEKPSSKVLSTQGVDYLGYLNKANPKDLTTYEAVLAHSFFLVHPTTMDASPTVIIEAGQFGCPSIAPAVFGIPDLIKNGVSGVLLPEGFSALTIKNIVSSFYHKKNEYLFMRQSCKNYVESDLNWPRVVRKILTPIFSQ